jgi:hypothetical protein
MSRIIRQSRRNEASSSTSVRIRVSGPGTPSRATTASTSKVPAPPTTGDEDVKSALDFLKAEYGTLRDETLQAMGAQQAILTWSLASFGAVLAAGLVLGAGIGPFATHKPQDLLFIVIFGLGLPVLSFTACLAWFGELMRMERVGHYIRGFEVIVAETYQSTSVSDRFSYLSAPLRWESYIAFEAKKGIAITKHQIGYFGHLGIYTGSVVLSLMICTFESWFFESNNHDLPVVLCCYSLLFFGAFLLVIFWLRYSLLEAASRAADIAALIPTRSKVLP